MKPYLDKAPKVVELVRLAYEKAGLTPIEEPIRGGTDGARLSSLGLPCPNVFTGGMNFHGIYECIPVKSLEKAADVAVKIAEVSATVKSLAYIIPTPGSRNKGLPRSPHCPRSCK